MQRVSVVKSRLEDLSDNHSFVVLDLAFHFRKSDQEHGQTFHTWELEGMNNEIDLLGGPKI